MKQRILVIGAGFAGMWAALSAARQAFLNQRDDIDVTVLAPQPELRVRPRFYEDGVAGLVAPLSNLFAATGVNFVAGHVEKIDTQAKTFSYKDAQGNPAQCDYQRLVLAAGSQVNHMNVAGAVQHAFDIDQLESAEKFEQHLKSLANRPATEARNTVVVCGGGFTGIELATELPGRLKAILGDDARTKVVVVERSEIIGSRWSSEIRETIKQASRELNLEWRLDTSVEAVDAHGVTLNDGSRIESDTVVWTVGVQASPLVNQLPAERDRQGRLLVDQNLKVQGLNDVYATGDVARVNCDDQGHVAMMTCQHAILLGKFAGNNVAAELIGVAPLPYSQPFYVTCLDLGAWGAVYTEGWQQEVKSVRAEGKKIKIAITNELIYPPKAEREAAFAAADPLAPFV